MERLTIKSGNTYKYNFNTNCDFEERDKRSIETHNKIVNKLGALEDFKESYGNNCENYYCIHKLTIKRIK